MTSPSSLKAAMLRRIAREGDWMESHDVYLAFNCEGWSVDKKLHDRISATLSRLHRTGLVEVDKDRAPWAYRISDRGRAELELLSDPEAYRRHLVERMQLLQEQRWSAPTAKQRDIYSWMCAYQVTYSMPPTMREICDAFGFASTNAANDHLRALEKKGLVVHRPKLCRGWLAVQSVEQPQPQQGAA